MEPHGGRIIFGIMGLMTVYRCRSFVFLVFLLILGPLARVVLTAHPQGPQRVPVPVPPTAKPGAARSKADRSNLPAIPTFKDVAKDVGLTPSISPLPKPTTSSIPPAEALGLFDCDDDGRLDVLLINGSTVERVRAGGDLLVTLYHQEPDGTFKDITKESRPDAPVVGAWAWLSPTTTTTASSISLSRARCSALYHGLGNCKFEDVTEKAGVGGSGFMRPAPLGVTTTGTASSIFSSPAILIST